ncbi:hypothetical protein E4U30_005915, partial [Claviceps sp. LM220 group G6]
SAGFAQNPGPIEVGEGGLGRSGSRPNRDAQTRPKPAGRGPGGEAQIGSTVQVPLLRRFRDSRSSKENSPFRHMQDRHEEVDSGFQQIYGSEFDYPMIHSIYSAAKQNGIESFGVENIWHR